MKTKKRILIGMVSFGVLFAIASVAYAATDFTAAGTDPDGNNYLGSDNVRDVFFYNTRNDSDEGA